MSGSTGPLRAVKGGTDVGAGLSGEIQSIDGGIGSISRPGAGQPTSMPQAAHQVILLQGPP